jgi:membrane protein DedA with SNARE-associated domain
MTSSYDQRTPLSSALMTGLFGGLISTIIILFYNIFFRLATNFPLSDIINVSSIIFVTNLIFLIVGLFYFFLHKVSAKGDTVYLVIIAALIIVLLWMTAGIQRSENPAYTHDFRVFLSGIIIVMGVSALLVPLLIRKKWFQDFFL